MRHLTLLATTIADRHMIGLAYAETDGADAPALHVDATPRDPDWTGISPLWQRFRDAVAVVLNRSQGEIRRVMR